VKNLISSQLRNLRKHWGPHYSTPVMANICLLTPTQPSVNPRIVKEADALAEAGHQVHVLCGHTVPWADESDATLLRSRNWSCSYVGGKPGSARHWWTRLRHGAIRRFPQIWKLNRTLARCALARITPELQAAALRSDADLYIAHYVGALVGAGVAAKGRNVLLAFDAEDFESGYYDYSTGPRPIDRLTEEVELEYLPRCCCVTGASSGIAEAYSSKYCIAMPVTILNVFPMAERPPELRETARGGPLKLYWFSQTIGHDRGLEDVIRAMAILRNCDIELCLRGRCASGYEEHLAQVASESGLSLSKITFCSPAPAEEMIRLSAEYDVGLALETPASPNRDLCVTNKIFSYLLAGNAIAATSTTGQKAVVEELGAAAFLYRPGDYEALARGLRVWHDDRSELERARQAAWSFGTYSFNWESEKKKVIDIVNSVLRTEENGAAIQSSVSA
jgi:glycosyltransferase involved in cell wall biosynthesis